MTTLPIELPRQLSRAALLVFCGWWSLVGGQLFAATPSFQLLSQTNHFVRVEGREQIATGQWRELIPGEVTVAATNGAVTFTDQRAGLTRQFYRLRGNAGLVYDLGTPVLSNLWVDPVLGDDANSGATRATALRSFPEAWDRVPTDTTAVGTGVRILLTAGTHPTAPNYLENRVGSRRFPIIIQAADGVGTAVLADDINMKSCAFVYFIGFTIRPQPAGDCLHLELCTNILVRHIEMDGGVFTSESQTTPVGYDTFKVNQCQYLYFEDSYVHGAIDNPVDWVAVQYGHAVRNRVANGRDWGMYVKGGSAYLRIEENEFYDCGTGGFTCGQGTGYQFMTAPWLHYETYDIKVVNNLIHDCDGAGLGVNGGYNILLAHNTLYRVGNRSHAVEFVFGGRTCDFDESQPDAPDRLHCDAYFALGGWGPRTSVTNVDHSVRIPNRNIQFVHNLIYNPPGYRTQFSHFQVPGVLTDPTTQTNSNVPFPTYADDNLVIRGNLIWNGPADHPTGLEETRLNLDTVHAENAINLFAPQLRNPVGGDFLPTPGGNVATFTNLYSVVNFSWTDAPTRPAIPTGNVTNTVRIDRAGRPRGTLSPPGAFLP